MRVSRENLKLDWSKSSEGFNSMEQCSTLSQPTPPSTFIRYFIHSYIIIQYSEIKNEIDDVDHTFHILLFYSHTTPKPRDSTFSHVTKGLLFNEKYYNFG